MLPEFRTDRLIVKPRPTASSSEIDNLRAEMGVLKVIPTNLGLQIWEIKPDTALQIKDALTGNSRLEYVQLDRIIRLDDFTTTSPSQQNLATTTSQTTPPNDTDYSKLWGLNNTGQTGGTADADIDHPEALALVTGTQKVPVGVIDSGIDYTHPDLAANMWTNPGEIPGNDKDDEGNGYIDDVHGFNFVNNNGNVMDDNNHGTHVAGTIGGVGNNGKGVMGVNPNNVSLVALKFLGADGSGATSNAILAIDYATRNAIPISNNSWGGPVYDQGLYDAIKTAGEKGGLFIAAAGNTSTTNDIVPAYPAAYKLPNILSVAATDHKDILASYSNFGKNVHIAAPGSDIYSTLPGGKYGPLSGTSMASPHVAGAAALLLSQNPSLKAEELKNTLVKTADPFTYPLLLPFVVDVILDLKAGRLNVADALQASTPNANSNLGQTQLPIASTLSPAGAGNLTETANAGAAEDILTGGPAADTLMLPFAEPSVSAMAPVTYFGSENIDFLTEGGAMMNVPALFSPAVNSAAPTLEKDVMPVFTQAQGALAGKQALENNSDPFAVDKTSPFADRYLVGLSDATKPLGF